MIAQVVVIAALSVLLGFGVITLARRGLLTFRYTMGWLALLTLTALSALFVKLAEPLSRGLSITPAAVVMSIGAVILMLICIQLSISISGLQQQVRKIAEHAALATAQETDSISIRHVLVIVPAFNEEPTIDEVTRELLDRGFNVLVIDDGSTDQTADKARRTGAHVIQMPLNTGVGGALRTGLKFAVNHGFPIVVQCDADGQHPVELIDGLVRAIQDRDCHMIIGSRFVNGHAEAMHVPTYRRVVMRILARSASHAVGTLLTDVTSGFRAFRGELVAVLAEHMPAYYLGDTYEAVISAGRAGYRIEEISAPIRERRNGKSSVRPISATQLTLKGFFTSLFHLHVRVPPPRS